MRPGKLIAIEGCDGSGKTTLINSLKEKYKNDPKFIFVKEPGSTAFGEEVRKIIFDNKYKDLSVSTLLFMFMASRMELLSKVIKPALQEGKTVICDRFALSTWVYQNAMDNMLKNLLTQLMLYLSSEIKVDNTIYLALDINTLKSRLDTRNNNNFLDQKPLSFYESILIWYDLGLHQVGFPENLLGEITIISNKSIQY